MKYNNFEKHISESFLRDSSAVDTDALIASLGLPVAIEPKRKVAWWIIAGLSLLFVFAIGVYYFMHSTQYNTKVTSNALETKISENPNTNLAWTAIGDSNGEENGNSEKINGEAIINNHKTDKVAPQEIVNTLKKVKQKSANVLVESLSTSSSNSKIDHLKIKEQNEVGLERNSPNFHSSQSNSEETKTIVNTEIRNENQMASEEANQERTIWSVIPVANLESNLRRANDLPGLAEPECPSFSYRIPWNISLLAEVGVMKPMKDLDNMGGTSAAFDLREANENSKEAIQVGLHAKVSKGKNPLYVRGGAAYTRIAEQMNEEYDYIELDTMQGLISITTSMTGDTVTAIYGDVVSEKRFTGRSVKHYFLHLLDIPVAIGYELPIANSFYAGAEVGVQFNIRTSGSGLIFKDVNDYVDLSEATSQETKVGLSYFGGFHLGYHINRRSSIQLSARFRYYPSKFSTVDSSINQRYNLAGLHAGYVFRF